MNDTQLCSLVHACAVAFVAALIIFMVAQIAPFALLFVKLFAKLVRMFGQILYDKLEHATNVTIKIVVLLAITGFITGAVIFAPLITIATVAVLMLALQLKRVFA